MKTVKNVTIAEFELAFTRWGNNLKTVRNVTVRNSLQDFDAIERYLHPKCQSVLFQKRRNCSIFIIFKCLHNAISIVLVRVPFSKYTVFKIYHFQNVPAKNMPFSCERETYPSHCSPFSTFSRHRVNAV